MDKPVLAGAEGEMQALAEWVEAMAALRHRLLDEPSTDADAAGSIQLLTLRLRQAENRLRAVVGLPALMH